ncbi:uncharacterized protein [Branchiostoma lanceolatum]|uniref:uncharacterized protein n=1 Tax=Branchiostoma lanceolatum TaxID=7740 RepID=UPI0034563358
MNPEGLRISEKSKQNESARWQRPRSPKSFLIDYWKVKEESKDTTKVAPKDVAKVESKDTTSFDMKDKPVEETKVLDDSYSRLLTCGTIKAEINDSEEGTSSNQMKYCSRSRINVMEVLPGDSTNLTDEMSLNVLKEEPETFYSFETQNSQRLVHTSQVQAYKCIDLRQYVHNSPVQVSSDEEDAVVSLEGRAGQAVSSLTGPVEQSSWTQPKALYTSDKREPQKQEESAEFQGSCGQEEADMNEAWTQPKALYTSDMRKPQMEEEKEAQGSCGHEEATVDEAGCRDGSKVSQVIRHQGSVARVTPQGSRQVATSAHPSSTLLQQGHPIVQLNELCQRNRLRICFQDISVTGPAHRPRVQLAAVVGDRTFQAQASSKKAARRKAAQDALQALYQEGYK